LLNNLYEAVEGCLSVDIPPDQITDKASMNITRLGSYAGSRQPTSENRFAQTLDETG
jgi:hypothetical protein